VPKLGSDGTITVTSDGDVTEAVTADATDVSAADTEDDAGTDVTVMLTRESTTDVVELVAVAAVVILVELNVASS